jgi:hypothetical protein
MAELTVRETLDHSARCFGAGDTPAYVEEIRRREKAMGIEPDPVVDAFMKAMALEGNENSINTDLMLRLLGLEVGVSELLWQGLPSMDSPCFVLHTS